MRSRTKPQAGQIARAFGGYAAVGLILIVVLAMCWLLYQREAHQVAGRQADLEVIRVNLIAAAGLVLLTLLCVWLFRGRLQAMRHLRTMNEELELRVRERTDELARSYEQLQHREQLLEETGRLAKVGGWEVSPDSETGIWTPEVARIHDVDPAAVSRKGVKTQSYTPESRARLQAALQEARVNGTPYDLDLEIVTARG